MAVNNIQHQINQLNQAYIQIPPNINNYHQHNKESKILLGLMISSIAIGIICLTVLAVNGCGLTHKISSFNLATVNLSCMGALLIISSGVGILTSHIPGAPANAKTTVMVSMVALVVLLGSFIVANALSYTKGYSSFTLGMLVYATPLVLLWLASFPAALGGAGGAAVEMMRCNELCRGELQSINQAKNRTVQAAQDLQQLFNNTALDLNALLVVLEGYLRRFPQGQIFDSATAAKNLAIQANLRINEGNQLVANIQQANQILDPIESAVQVNRHGLPLVVKSQEVSNHLLLFVNAFRQADALFRAAVPDLPNANNKNDAKGREDVKKSVDVKNAMTKTNQKDGAKS